MTCLVIKKRAWRDSMPAGYIGFSLHGLSQSGYMVYTVIDIELTCRRKQTFDTGLLLEGLGIEDDDLTIGFLAVRTVPD